MTDDRLIEILRKLSEELGFTMEEICEITRTIAQVDYDPLPPDQWGDVFDEWRRAPVFENDDFCTLVDPVPPPNAQVDLLRAALEFSFDAREAAWALKRELSKPQLEVIARNQTDWCRFWALRHRKAEVRAEFKAALAERDIIIKRANCPRQEHA